MRRMLLVAGLLLATHVQAQETAQRQLNAMTGAPPETRCFQSVTLAQELTTQYVASGICREVLDAVDPATFMNALAELKAIDDDFTTDACQAQIRLMFRFGQEWFAKDQQRRCAETAKEMRDKSYFQNYVRGR